jgi:hypothetical protein
MSYELWTILNKWRKDFSSEEFARTFASPSPRKVLHDMAKKGMIEHNGYGRYSVRTINDYVSSKNNISSGYELLKESKLPYALTDVDGVFVWTKGGYNAGRFFGSYPIHVKVRESDVAKWKNFLAEHKKKTMLDGEKPEETLYGVYYVLYPENSIKSETVNGLEVEPLKKTVEFSKRNIYTFKPALEMLDEEYGLGLGTRYSR